MTATQRLYWNKDRTKLVPEGKEAAFLAFPVGSIIPDELADKAGTSQPEPETSQGDAVDNLEDRSLKPTRRRQRSE